MVVSVLVTNCALIPWGLSYVIVMMAMCYKMNKHVKVCNCVALEEKVVMNTKIDVDECYEAALSSSVICTQNNTQCINVAGDFECVCVDGYEATNGECHRKLTNFLLVLQCLILIKVLLRWHFQCLWLFLSLDKIIPLPLLC